MFVLYKSNTRGTTSSAWLTSHHTFSFADYYNPSMMGFGHLRVINEDFIEASSGFPMHSHKDMEIITYVVSGALIHKDSLGNGSVIQPGEIQRMSAGVGVKHSEYNALDNEELHLLQIWILPETTGITPSYEQKKINRKDNEWILIGSPNPDDSAVLIHQRADLMVSYLTKNATVLHSLGNKNAWVQVIKGHINLNHQTLESGDAVALSSENNLSVTCLSDSAELLLFEFYQTA